MLPCSDGSARFSTHHMRPTLEGMEDSVLAVAAAVRLDLLKLHRQMEERVAKEQQQAEAPAAAAAGQEQAQTGADAVASPAAEVQDEAPEQAGGAAPAEEEEAGAMQVDGQEAAAVQQLRSMIPTARRTASSWCSLRCASVLAAEDQGRRCTRARLPRQPPRQRNATRTLPPLAAVLFFAPFVPLQ